MKTVTVFPNRDKDPGLECTKRAVSILRAHDTSVRLPEDFENDITEPADDLSFVSAKYFKDRFNGHVVMEQAEIRDFC